MENIDTLEAALGFFAGCVFMSGVMWTFLVLPAQRARDKAYETAKADREELKNRLIADLEVYRRARGTGV